VSRRRKGKPMGFELVRPCPHCPFRSDVPPYLTPARAEDLAEALDTATFACHETTYGQAKVEQHCAGVLLIMARQERWGSMQQIAQRFGLLDADRLDLTAPVYASFAAFVLAYGGTPRGWLCGLRPS